jgi:hypothetical protein
MNRSTRYARRSAGPALALAAAGLVLAGCGSSGGSASGSSGTPGSSHPSGGSTKAAASGGSASTSATGSSGSASGYANWPIGVGNTWLYQNSLGGTVTNKMTAVVPVPGGKQVTQSDTIDLAGSPTTTNGTYIFHSDGSITYPANAFGNGISIKGGIGLPSSAAVASGQPTKSVLQVSVNQDGQHFSETAHITVRGAGTASVTVPAGTYQATIVDLTMAMTVDNIPVSIEVRTWLANGVGPVQSEVISTTEGVQHVSDEQKLESFTKG